MSIPGKPTIAPGTWHNPGTPDIPGVRVHVGTRHHFIPDQHILEHANELVDYIENKKKEQENR